MKKIISLGAAAAVLSLTAVAASAAIAPTMTPATPVAGETVTVEVVATGMTQEATTFTVKASENLTFVEATPVATGLADFNKDTMKFAWAGSSVPADGTVLLTLTFTVDAASDEEVSVALVADAGFVDISADAVAAVVVDGAAADVTVEATVEDTAEVDTAEVDTAEVDTAEVDTAEVTEDAGLTDTAEETVEDTAEATEDAGANSGASTDDGKGNPATGVALAVVPAVLAGAAIVVAKKRK